MNLAAETVERGHLDRTEQVKAFANFCVWCAVDHQTGNAAQFEETLAEWCEGGVYMADDGVGVVAFIPLELGSGERCAVCTVFLPEPILLSILLAINGLKL